MERKSKAQILEKYLDEYNKQVSDLHKFKLTQRELELFAVAMNDYADQEMALLLEWMDGNGFMPGWGDGKYRKFGDPNIYTYQQLLTIYKESHGI